MHNKVHGQNYAFCCKLQPITRKLFRRWIFTRAPVRGCSIRRPSLRPRHWDSLHWLCACASPLCCSVASFVAVVIGALVVTLWSTGNRRLQNDIQPLKTPTSWTFIWCIRHLVIDITQPDYDLRLHPDDPGQSSTAAVTRQHVTLHTTEN